MSLLVNTQGVSFLAKEIKDRLAAIDPRLGLAIERIGSETKWAVTLWWKDDDPRRAEVQGNKYDPARAFDVLGHLPKDCPVESAFDYIQRRFRVLSSRADVREMLDGIHRFNADLRKEILKPHEELVEELVKTNARHIAKGVGKGWTSSLDVGKKKSKRDDKDWLDYLHDVEGS